MGRTTKTDKILGFSAIPKTGGITLLHLLRRHFGVRHFDCLDRHRPPGGNHHLAEDLRYDLRIYPWARSIAGHGLKPFIDYQEFDSRLLWYTMVREPVARFISQYKYEVDVMGRKEGFTDWMNKYPRDDYQVRWLAGEQNLEAAKEMVLNRMSAVGLVERYDESLLIFRQRLGIPNWKVVYGRPRNVGRQDGAFAGLPELVERHQDEVVERNSLDIALYEFVRDEVWPTYVREYGGSQKLNEDLGATFNQDRGSDRASLKLLWRETANRTYRNLVYKPLVMLDHFTQRRRGAKQTVGSAD